jgi:tetratricopeptide (TPR) repeat protein
MRLLLLSLLAITSVDGAAKLPRPTKQPAAQNAERRKLLQEGVQLHDLGDWKGAIQRFERVLLQDADDITAIYELAYTLMAAKEYQKSLDQALKGAEYQSPLLADFYAVIGYDYDELGRPSSAEAVYREGMKAFPSNPMLPFNFVITCEREKKPLEARRLYQTALWAAPAHASSHYRLSALYTQTGYLIPGLLAALRFLELNQDTRRSQQALQSVLNQILGGARDGDQPNHINITLNLGESSKTDEGDFRGAGALLGLGSALRFTEEGKKISRPDLVRHQHELLFQWLHSDEKLRKTTKRFAAVYYAAYFGELEKAHHTEAFTYTILRHSGWPEVAEWVERNAAAIKAYRDWAAAYQWPAAPVGKR